MGFSRNGCTRALYETKNSGVEAAMNWVMEHMGDPDFSDPFNPPGAASGGQKKCTAGEEVIAMVMSMGFSKEQAETGLRNTDNNVERAIEWIFSHPDGEEAAQGGEEPTTNSFGDVKDGNSRYRTSMITTLYTY